MDREMVELLLAEITNLWPGPMSDFERARWIRVFWPKSGSRLDPDNAAQAFMLLHLQPAFESVRPTVEAFDWAYEECVAARDVPYVDPELFPKDMNRAMEHLDRCRAALEGSGMPATGNHSEIHPESSDERKIQ